MTDGQKPQPCHRTDFQIAIICALKIECDAVEALFDQTWDATKLGKAQSDHNAYSAGRIGQHDIVLAFMPGMGKARSASVATALCTSFVNVRLALVVGVCGGSPKTFEGDDILLGDVIISNRVIQTDFGRLFSDSLRIKDTGLDGLARPSHAISSFLNKLSGLEAARRLTDRAQQHLQNILDKDGFKKWQYPGAKEDILYHPQYRHKHQSPTQCAICRECTSESDTICEDALTAACAELGCANDMLLNREIQNKNNRPHIHQGVFASSDQVIKSASHRDKLLEQYKAIGFEMEGAGVWDSLPTVIVKGVCDYADSHKNKNWQRYAAASAAATTKAVLSEWTVADGASAQPQSEASRIFKVPFNPDDIPNIREFVGRDSELIAISQALSFGQNDQPEARKMFVAYGLGGIGKTQIAARFAFTRRDQFSAVIWIDGTTLASAKSSLSSFAPRASIGAANDLSSTDENVKAILAWLAQDGNTNWLMVFDNVDLDIDAKPPDSQAYRIQDLFPPADHGSILITSRLQSMCRLGENKRIAKLSQEESVKLVEQHLGRSITGDEGAKRVIEKLDGLPLALAMASSFIRETAMTFNAYSLHYQTTWSELLEQQDEYPLQEYAQRPMLVTWRLSYAEVERQSTDAVQLLKLFSFFNNKGLTQDILRVSLEPDLPVDPRVGWYEKVSRSGLSFTRPLRLLLRYSLIDEEAGENGLAIHSVLHEWVHNMLSEGPEDDYQTICNLAGHLLAQQVPFNEQEANYWPIRRSLAPHTDTFGRRLETDKRQVNIAPDDLFNIGHVLGSCAVLSYAEVVYLQAMQGFEEALGPDDSSTLMTVNNLGDLYRDQGKLESAEQMFIRALQGKEKALGPDHTSTLVTVSNLGNLYRDQGKLESAEQMYIRALQGKEKVLGPDHTSTLNTVNSLGVLYCDQGKLESAEQMYIRALQGYKKVLGLDHTSTLDTINNLGNLYRNQGKLESAEQMYIRALQGYEKVLGLDHTSTFNTVNNIGNLYRGQGKLESAEQMYIRALQGYEKALGPDHTSTLHTVSNLGDLYHDQGKRESAEQMFIRALQGKEKALGPDHTSTLHTVSNLGDLYHDQGKRESAEQMYIRALQGYEKALGPDHTSTLAIANNLGVLYRHQGKLELAEQLYTRALQGYKKVLGPDHPSTQRARTNLDNVKNEVREAPGTD